MGATDVGAIHGFEAALLVLWLLGVGAAICVRFLGRRRSGIGLLLVAALVPVLGSVVAVAVALADLHATRAAREGALVARSVDRPKTPAST